MYATIEQFGNNIALISENGQSLTYAELVTRADALVQPLGTKPLLIGIECENLTDVLLAYIGALRAGHVVLLTGNNTSANTAIFTQFRPNYVFKRHEGGGYSFVLTSEEAVDLHPDLAVLLSTSGTTGSAKLVRLSHANIAANATSIATYLGLTTSDRAITSLPMQYSYGLSVINSHLSCGASLILTGKSVTDPDFWNLFDTHKATNFQGVPHSFQLLQHSGFLKRPHPSLRFFTQAGGKLPEALVTTFADYAQSRDVRFYVMYGQTEATARMAWLPPEDTLKYPDVIGQAIPGGTFHIESEGQSVPDGEAGELVYRGPNVMMGYALTRADLSLDKTTHELRTGDIAVKTPSGYFKITGRVSRFIKVFGLRIGLDEIEARIRDKGYINAATGTDETLIIALENEEGRAKIASFVENELGLPANACRILTVSALPRTYNGKTDYSAIKQLASQDSSPPTDNSLLAEAEKLFGKAGLDGKKSFVQLGGDSLSYVHFALAVEQRLGQLPENWERIPLNRLEQMAQPVASQSAPKRHIPMDIVLRAVAILMVLINHVTLNNMDGSGVLLLALAGYNFGRFQAPKIADGQGLSVLRSLFLNVLIPYYLTLLPIAFLMGPDKLPNLFLMYNFVPDHIRSELPITLIYFWYIEAYIIIITALTVVLSLPVLRKVLKTHGWIIPLLLFIALEILRGYSEDDGDRGIFNLTSPLIVGSRFALGWFLFTLPTRKLRIIAALVFIPYVGLHPLGAFEHTWYILAPGLTLLVLVSSVPMSGFAARYITPFITLIATSSLYIYMEQFYVINIAEKFGIPLSLPAQILTVIASLIVGIAIQLAITKATALYARRQNRVSAEPI